MQRAFYRALLLFATTGLAIWAFGQIFLPFIIPIAWALCLCAVTARPYRFLTRHWNKPRLAALLMVLITAVTILGPMVVMGAKLVEEATQVDLHPAQRRLQQQLPEVAAWVDQALGYLRLGSLEQLADGLQDDLPRAASRILGGSTLRGALAVLVAPFLFLFGLAVALVTQYFVYRESPRLRRLVHELSPLDDGDTDRVLETLRGTTAAAIIGGVLVAIIQGALGGVAFYVAGVPSPLLWSVMMMGVSLLPFGGTALVWFPVGLYLVLTGSTSAGYSIFDGEAASGWFILIWGTVVVGGSDNFLRPWILTKAGAKDIHPMLLFFAILSGIGLFGFSGIVFGPLLLALLITMMHIYREHWVGKSADQAPEEETPDEAPYPL